MDALKLVVLVTTIYHGCTGAAVLDETIALNEMIALEMEKVIPAISDRLEGYIKDIKTDIESDLITIMSQLDGRIQLDLTPSEAVKYGNQTKNWGPNQPLGSVELPIEILEELTKNITQSLEDKVSVVIEEKMTNYLTNFTDNSDNHLLSAINALEKKYSHLYRKLYQYTSYELNLINKRLDAFNVPTLIEVTEIPEDITEIPETTTTGIDIVTRTDDTIPRDCAEALTYGMQSGITIIQVEGLDYTQAVWCDQDTDGGGWTVFLQRQHLEGEQLNFKKTYNEYKEPFGSANEEYWIGLNALHQITSNYGKEYMLRVDISDKNEDAFGIWEHFKVDAEMNGYKLEVLGYLANSTAGDAMKYHSGMEFSTYDNDNDKASGGSCSDWSGGGGWWYNYCFFSNPTGIYPYSDLQDGTEADHFLEWRKWQGYYFYFNNLTLKVRPTERN